MAYQGFQRVLVRPVRLFTLEGILSTTASHPAVVYYLT